MAIGEKFKKRYDFGFWVPILVVAQSYFLVLVVFSGVPLELR